MGGVYTSKQQVMIASKTQMAKNDLVNWVGVSKGGTTKQTKSKVSANASELNRYALMSEGKQNNKGQVSRHQMN